MLSPEVRQINIYGKTFIPYIAFEEIEHAIGNMAAEIHSQYKNEIPLFVGVLNGVVMFMSDFLKNYPGMCEVAFLHLSSYEDLKSTGKVKVISDIPISIENRHIIILEDIVDSGTTLALLHDRIGKQNVASMQVASLFFKSNSYKQEMKIDHVGIEIEDKFVVGYGLDFDGFGRNLPDLYQLKEGE